MHPDQLEKIVSRLGLSIQEPRLVRLQIDEPIVTDQKSTLLEAIRAFAPEQGWLVLQKNKNIRHFHSGELPAEIDQDRLLYGEITKSGETLDIRQNGQGGWKLVRHREIPGNDGKDLQPLRLCFSETIELLGERDPSIRNATSPKLLYRVYWIYERNFGYRQLAARFLGFKNQENLRENNRTV